MTSLPTPDFSHLSSADYENVYEPSEDTFLLLDALEAEADAIRSLRPKLCVELGPGSGVVITGLATLLHDEHDTPAFVAVDINPKAVEATRKTAERNGCRVDVRLGDLWKGLSAAELGAVDILLFNPPYVVTPSEEVGGQSLSAAWAGGIDGREVIDRLLPQIPAILSPNGRFYLLALRENLLPGTPRDITRAIPGFTARMVLSRRAGPEHLSVLCYTRDMKCDQ